MAKYDLPVITILTLSETSCFLWTHWNGKHIAVQWYRLAESVVNGKGNSVHSLAV